MIANGTLACTDHDYEKPVTQLHVGEKLFLAVTDADLDVSDERDQARVEVTSSRGEKETLDPGRNAGAQRRLHRFGQLEAGRKARRRATS